MIKFTEIKTKKQVISNGIVTLDTDHGIIDIYDSYGVHLVTITLEGMISKGSFHSHTGFLKDETKIKIKEIIYEIT